MTLAPTVVFNSIKCINYEFWKKLRECRDTKNLSQSQLAKEVGVHQNVIGRYERGDITPSIDVVSKIADALEVSVDYLIGKTNLLLDKEAVDRLVRISELNEDNKTFILNMIDMALRDFKTKKAYA
ncbi:XRE family transcriptional regulator [Psychroflexus gondwanensis ACAM 44]|uniref:XRE family transcriptional regulator n=1 Tax=Psychroflexus gondwanensis ACAM 44 TaxID=1189619 RepID=N1WV84_9FLAO|nr:helix-turn-helix transcriptional regulator [Psychroflexus gondwanensis]EMY80999.1 XRE family transcriptional regulator [Psychroflexus gondwanensis ACAM 44]